MKISMNIKRLNENAKIPSYASSGSAGADIYACLDAPVTVEAGQTRLIPTGFAIALPEGYAGLIYARSGLASKKGLAPANKVGVVDSDYRGEVMVAIHNHGSTAQTVEHGERIAQLVVAPVMQADFTEVNDLDSTERGAGGFGSTGSK